MGGLSLRVGRLMRGLWAPLALLAVVGGYVISGGGGLLRSPSPWQRGDWWVVATRLPPAAMRLASLGWTEGPTYRFTVLGTSRAKGQDCWRVQVDQVVTGAPAQPVAELYYTRERLLLADGRYFGPGGQTLPWPEAAAYIRVPVEIARLSGQAAGRPVVVTRQGVGLRAEALDLAPGRTEVWSGQSPWWLRLNVDGVIRAETVDSSWWHGGKRQTKDWRRVLRGDPVPAPISPYTLAPSAVPAEPAAGAGAREGAQEGAQEGAAPGGVSQGGASQDTAGPVQDVKVTVWIDGKVVGELARGTLPLRPGTHLLPLKTRKGQVLGVLYCTISDPEASRLQLERLVLLQPEYIDRSLSGLAGTWAVRTPLQLEQGNLRVRIEKGTLR